MDPAVGSNPIFTQIAPLLEKWGINQNSDPTEVLIALNSKLSSVLSGLPGDYLDPVFSHKLTTEQEGRLNEVNLKFQKDYVAKHKVALHSLDLLLPCVQQSSRVSQEATAQIQEQRQQLHPFCRNFTLFDVYNTRDFCILQPEYEDYPVPPTPVQGTSSGPQLTPSPLFGDPEGIDVKTALFDLSPPPSTKKKRSKGKQKKAELKARREAQPKKGFVKAEKPVSKSQLKKQAQKEARLQAQQKKKEETDEKQKGELEENERQTIRAKKQQNEDKKKQRHEGEEEDGSDSESSEEGSGDSQDGSESQSISDNENEEL